MSFRETCQLPVEQIEFDVQMSKDGIPVIFHDATLDRVTDGTGPLANKTLSELKALSIFKNGGPIMTLAEGLDILAPSHLTLRCEIKPGVDLLPHPGLVAKVLDMIEDRGLVDRTVMTSFHLPTLREVAATAVPVRDIIWLVADPILQLTSPEHVACLALGEGIQSVSPRHTLLRNGVLETLRGLGLSVGAFAVLEDDAIIWALEAGIEVFTTDRPDAAIRLRDELIRQKGHVRSIGGDLGRPRY